jgi:tetratricopeptide (TPR) repeat protein
MKDLVLQKLQTAMKRQIQGDLPFAEQAYLELLQENPDLADANHLLGLIRGAQQREPEAIELIEKAIRLDPLIAAYHHNIAGIYRRVGRFDHAEKGFRSAIDLKADYGEAYQGLFEVVACHSEDPVLGKLRAQLDHSDLSEVTRSYLHFAAGKACEDMADFKQAFSHYLKANKLAGKSYDPSQKEAFFKDIVFQYSHEVMEKTTGAGHLSDQPIFIVGMPRSGTSLVEQILASHSSVFGAGEVHDLAKVIASASRQNPGKRSFPFWLTGMNPASFRLMGKTYLDRLVRHCDDGQYARIVDKHPLNFQYLGFIRQILPNAKIVHTTRDAMDTCLSCFFQNFTQGQEYSFNLSNLGHFYNHYRRLMSHWLHLMPGSICEINYEQLLTHPEQEIRRLLQFCGLPYEPGCMAFHQTQRAVKTASFLQVRQPLYQHSRNRWLNYRQQLQPLASILDIKSAESAGVLPDQSLAERQ